MREVLKTALAGSPWRMPRARDLAELARRCEYWRQWCNLEREEAASVGKQQQKIRKLLDECRRAHLELRETFEQYMNAAFEKEAPALVCAIWQHRLKKLNKTLECIEAANSLYPPFFVTYLDPPVGHGWVAWKAYGPTLADEFRAAMRSTNPGFGEGDEIGRELTQFLAALVPLCTGEHPTANSINTQLKRIRKAKSRKTLVKL
jgi:hypothetical protein